MANKVIYIYITIAVNYKVECGLLSNSVLKFNTRVILQLNDVAPDISAFSLTASRSVLRIRSMGDVDLEAPHGLAGPLKRAG